MKTLATSTDLLQSGHSCFYLWLHGLNVFVLIVFCPLQLAKLCIRCKAALCMLLSILMKSVTELT
jgi:hypothetical protein